MGPGNTAPLAVTNRKTTCMLKSKLLLIADPAQGGDPTPPPAPAAPDLAPPPGAAIVAAGKKTERELQLESELEKAKRLVKEREIRAAELEDENRRLKEIPADPPAPPAAKGAPWTFFDETD